MAWSWVPTRTRIEFRSRVERIAPDAARLSRQSVPAANKLIAAFARNRGLRLAPRRLAAAGLSLGVLLSTGCFKISINPTCPATASVGDTGDLSANQKDAGQIPTYNWEATPPAAVQITDPTKADTTFKAKADGDVTFRLTASDGLFQVQGTCKTQIVTSSVVVTIVANPLTVDQGGSTLLTCTSTGATPAVSFVIDQAGGPTAQRLTTAAPGSAVAILGAAGDAVFRCIGADASGNQSPPAQVTVTVRRSGGGVR